eukprot:9493927-Pyramimonas_sp.AAC.1
MRWAIGHAIVLRVCVRALLLAPRTPACSRPLCCCCSSLFPPTPSAIVYVASAVPRAPSVSLGQTQVHGLVHSP